LLPSIASSDDSDVSSSSSSSNNSSNSSSVHSSSGSGRHMSLFKGRQGTLTCCIAGGCRQQAKCVTNTVDAKLCSVLSLNGMQACSRCTAAAQPLPCF
jgi:hypothetical protein